MEDYETCTSCNGSGEGPADGTTCWKCKGSGVEYIEDNFTDEDDLRNEEY